MNELKKHILTLRFDGKSPYGSKSSCESDDSEEYTSRGTAKDYLSVNNGDTDMLNSETGEPLTASQKRIKITKLDES